MGVRAREKRLTLQHSFFELGHMAIPVPYHLKGQEQRSHSQEVRGVWADPSGIMHGHNGGQGIQEQKDDTAL